MKVNWDDYQPYIWENSKNGNQTTNQWSFSNFPWEVWCCPSSWKAKAPLAQADEVLEGQGWTRLQCFLKRHGPSAWQRLVLGVKGQKIWNSRQIPNLRSPAKKNELVPNMGVPPVTMGFKTKRIHLILDNSRCPYFRNPLQPGHPSTGKMRTTPAPPVAKGLHILRCSARNINCRFGITLGWVPVIGIPESQLIHSTRFYPSQSSLALSLSLSSSPPVKTAESTRLMLKRAHGKWREPNHTKQKPENWIPHRGCPNHEISATIKLNPTGKYSHAPSRWISISGTAGHGFSIQSAHWLLLKSRVFIKSSHSLLH